MISQQIMQSTVEELSSIAELKLCVFDAEAKPVALSEPKAEVSREELKTVRDFLSSSADAQEIRGAWYFKVYDADSPIYILTVGGTGEHAHTTGRMAAFQLASLNVAYRERFDKDGFFKNLLLDNLLLVDIYSRAKKLHIAEDTDRVCLVIRAAAGADPDPRLPEIIRGVTDSGRDTVTQVDESEVIVVHELPSGQGDGETEPSDRMAQLKEYAASILKVLDDEGLKLPGIACGNIVHDLKDVSRSYKEARMALDVGRIFYENIRVICYSELGIGRLIYQLPLPLCRMFLQETFGDCVPGIDIDQEIIDTVKIFFENSLNVSETARMLFIHRNSLVYRLDKLQKITGLDVRVFEDAMTYCIAMMVVRYMKYMEEENF